METHPRVVKFNGITFRRYPSARAWAEQVYFVPNAAHRRRGVGRLHEEIWKSVHGPIPEGRHIHHIDFNPLNNDPSNLACLTPAEHARVHAEHGKPLTPRMLEHLEAIRPLAAEWHRSEAGREWHRKHAINCNKQRAVRRRECRRCGQAFETLTTHAQFCGPSCKAAARRAARKDMETRQCPQCRCDFSVNRYTKTRCCSRSCASKLKHRPHQAAKGA